MLDGFLPSCTEVEEQVVSALLVSPELLSDYGLDLGAECFSDRSFREIYQALATLSVNSGSKCDLFTITDYLEKNDALERIGGRNRLIELYALDTYSNNSLPGQIALLNDYLFKRHLIDSGREIAKLGYNCSETTDELGDLAKQKLDSCLQLQSGEHPVKVDSLVDKIKEYVERGKSKGLSSGFTLLDRLLGGFKPAKLYILAARTGMGKTNLAVFFALQIAKASEYPVLFFSAEMSVESLSIRFISNLAGVNSAHINHDYMDWEERDRYAVGLEEFSRLNLIIDETPANKLDPATISRRVRAVSRHYGGVSAVFIDYIQLLGSYTVQRRDLAIGEISRACKDLGKTHRIPFVVLAQVKREVETRANKRPLLSDLKDSGQLEQDADAIAFIYRDEYYNKYTEEPDTTELIVAKHRDGTTGTIKLEHDLGTCQYKEPKTFAINTK